MADEDLSSQGDDEGGVAASATDDGNDDDQQPDPVAELAQEMGWRPKAEWKGDEADWVPARDFLKTTRDINRTMGRELKDLKKQLDGIGKATATMTRQALAQQKAELEAAHDRAVEEGDTEAARKAIKDLQSLPPEPVAAPPEAQDFTERNAAWWGTNTEATSYAINRSNKYAKDGLSPARQIAAVERDMKQHFPDLFPEAKPRSTQPSLGTPQRTVTTQPREKGYATLPPAARKACDDWVKEQKENGAAWATKDMWAKSFYETEAANG